MVKGKAFTVYKGNTSSPSTLEPIHFRKQKVYLSDYSSLIKGNAKLRREFFFEGINRGIVSGLINLRLEPVNGWGGVPEGGDYLAVAAGMETFPGFLGFAGGLGGGVDPASGGQHVAEGAGFCSCWDPRIPGGLRVLEGISQKR